jgi:hypothetical protein
MDNEKGQVAIVAYRPVSQTVQIKGKTYDFQLRNRVSLAWVDKEDVGAIFKITRHCCGDTRVPMYYYANEAQVRIWSGGSR